MAELRPHHYAEPATGVPIRHYRPELDVVRFLAFFSVFLHHTLFLNHKMLRDPVGPSVKFPWGPALANACGFGLSLFFVLSAFLISDLLMRERAKNGDVDIPAFFQRRIRRIWPLYLLGLGLGQLWSIAAHAPAGARFLVYFFLAGNWYCVFHGWGPNPMTILWSISIEEQFYLLWPAVARYATRRTMYLVCFALLVIANGCLYHFGAIHADLEVRVWANSFVQFEMFAAGILIALVLRQRLPKFHWAVRLLLLLAWPLLWFSAVYFFHAKELGPAVSSSSVILGYALAAIGSASLLLGLLGIRASVVPRPLAYLGRISYGLYVFHMLAKQFVRIGFLAASRHLASHGETHQLIQTILALALTIAMAAVSYQFFEVPFLRRRPARV
jgi:peptidoglycan/LPS O-acetylase OafA/YrhL